MTFQPSEFYQAVACEAKLVAFNLLFKAMPCMWPAHTLNNRKVHGRTFRPLRVWPQNLKIKWLVVIDR